jgi:pimeloyl-ACP methyl ester carboxylesterase
MRKLFLLAALLGVFSISAIGQVKINVKLAPNLKGPYTGKLLVYTLSDTTKHFSGDASENEAAFSIPVNNWLPEKTITLPENADFLNKKIGELPDGYYRMIAVLDTNISERRRLAVGNLFTRKEEVVKVEKGKPTSVDLVLNFAMPEQPFKENDSIKLVKFLSPSLTALKKKNTYILGGLFLPPSYNKDKNRVYPIVFINPGWGGTHYQVMFNKVRELYGVGVGEEKIYVFLNPEAQTPYGLHAFVDSKVNGPWGTAFVNEFIPYLEANYRVSKNPKLHFLTGQSSGGYGALWLALNFPTKFGGTWVTSPDPVDFSNFTGVNLYKDKNFYFDADGKERGFMRIKDQYQTTIKKVTLLERFEGDGGQQQSFEAEFGIPDANGKPMQLMDTQTGAINPTVVKAWKDYDMALYTLAHAKELKKLAGPVYIYVGGSDNYLLNEAAKAYKAKTEKLGLNIKVIEVPGADHFSVRNIDMSKLMQAEIDTLVKGVK